MNADLRQSVWADEKETLSDLKTLLGARRNYTVPEGGVEELVSFVYRECSFPHGCLIMTGTGIVPGSDFTLKSGDEINISIDNIGTLSNTVQ